VGKSTLAGAVAEAVAGFANEFVGVISAEEFASVSDLVTLDPALEVERALGPAFVWAHPQQPRIKVNEKAKTAIRMLRCYSRYARCGNQLLTAF